MSVRPRRQQDSRRRAITCVALGAVLGLTGCSDDIELPEYFVTYITSDGSAVARSVDGIDDLALRLEFEPVPVPENLNGVPLVRVEGFVHPTRQPEVRSYYGPPESASVGRLVQAILSQYPLGGAPASLSPPPVRLEIDGVTARLRESGNLMYLTWDACERSFSVSISATEAEAVKAASEVIRTCVDARDQSTPP